MDNPETQNHPPKIMFNLPEAKYFDIDAESNSALSRLKRSPAHYQAYLKAEHKETPAMRLGSLLHTLVLEPLLYADRYYVEQEGDPKMPRKQEVLEMIAVLLEAPDNFDALFRIDDGSKPTRPKAGCSAAKIVEILESSDSADIAKLFAISPTGINKKTKAGREEYSLFERQAKEQDRMIVNQEDLDKACEYVNWHWELGERTLVKHGDFVVAENYASYWKIIDGKTVITSDELQQATAMAKAVVSHPSARKLLGLENPDCHSEVSITWTDENGLYCKARLDRINHMGHIVDLKSTTDASKAEFCRSIAKFGYHRQAVWYSRAYQAAFNKPARGFVFIAVEKEAPFAVGVYILDPDSFQQGEIEIDNLTAQLANCIETDTWPAYSDKVQTIELPNWYK